MAILAMLMFANCSGTASEEKVDSNAKFEWVDLSQISLQSWKTLDTISYLELSKSESETIIPLSKLVGKFQLIPLTNEPNHLLGDIDKVLFNDSLIFIMDQFITNSLQIFERSSGKELYYLGSTGDGPGEFRDIYDFDIDRKSKLIYLFDGRLSKILTFDFEGKFLSEFKIPIRAGNFRRFENGEFIFYSQDLPNDHLNEILNCNYFLLDPNFELKSCFSTHEKLNSYSDFFARDYFISDGKKILLFPRFENNVLELRNEELTLKKVLKLSLANSIEIEDLVGDGKDFVEERRKDFKYFSNGAGFLTNNWLGLKYERFGKSPFYLFQNQKTGKKVLGNQFQFDIQGLPFFSFPISSFENEAASVIKFENIRAKGLEKFLSDVDNAGLKTSELEFLLSGIDDFDQPAILIFEFEN